MTSIPEDLIFEMPSNSGRECVSIRSPQLSGSGVVLATVEIRTEFFERDLASGAIASSRIDEFCRITLNRFPIRVVALAQLCAVLRDCSNRPDFAAADVELGDQGYSLVVGASHPDESWAERRKPVFRVRYRVPSNQGETAFVIDQSCARLAVEGLDEWLTRYGRLR